MPFPNGTPYTDMHEINLNKFLKAIKNLLGGHGGEYLKKKSNIPFDYEWAPVSGGGGGSVDSVNGQTGVVVLTASDVGALPDSYVPPPAPVQSVNNKTGAVILSASDVGALPSSYAPPVQSVNGQTGAVVLDASDVGALPDSYVPPAAPVQSVNGQTGAVVLDASDVGALPDSFVTPEELKRVQITVLAGSAESYSFDTGPYATQRILMSGHTSVTAFRGIYIIYNNTVVPVMPASNLTVTVSGTVVTIRNNASSGTLNGIIV